MILVLNNSCQACVSFVHNFLPFFVLLLIYKLYTGYTGLTAQSLIQQIEVCING